MDCVWGTGYIDSENFNVRGANYVEASLFLSLICVKRLILKQVPLTQNFAETQGLEVLATLTF